MELMTIKEFVTKRKQELRAEMESLPKVPHLCIIRVGDDPASEAYVRGKSKDAAEVGFYSDVIVLPKDTSEEELLSLINEKNVDGEIDGILVQLPVPKGISTKAINDTIAPSKDVDGFVPNSHFTPCTPKGIVDYLKEEGFSFAKKNAVVLGRSQIVGTPMAKLLLSLDCNVTVLHSKTSDEDRRFYLKHADLVVSAIGKMGYLDESYEFKKDAILVDVGINRDKNGKLHGDFVPSLPVKLQTPVPGGVGLLTRLALLENLLEATKNELLRRK